MKGKLIEAIADYECDLYKDSGKSNEMKLHEYWGALMVGHKTGAITWDDARRMFGEFCSRIFKLR